MALTAKLAGRGGSRVRRVIVAVVGAALCAVALPSAALAASAPLLGVTKASVSENTVTLTAAIRPEGLDTTYEFWLQYATCSGCESIVSERVGQGLIRAEHLEQVVDVELTSLKWEYTYTAAVIASNADGTRESYPVQFTTLSPPPEGSGGSGAGPPYKSKQEPWVGGSAGGSAGEAPQREAERQAKKREEEERPAKQAAERAAKEREDRESGERAGREAAERAVREKQQQELLAGQASMCLVPSLAGDTLARARAALRKAHCDLGRVTQPHGRHARLVVVSQSHPKGTRLAQNAHITVRLDAVRHTRR